MKITEQQTTDSSDKRTAQFWNSETKSFETWYIHDCDICGKSVDRVTGECKEYKCWI